jgi:von Willebrand factor A domain-containing protein 7
LLSASILLVFGQHAFSSPQQTCGKADPAYIRTANESGGIPMFLERSEVAKAFHLVREITRNDMSTALWATGSLDGQPQTAQIPVDSTSRRITFAFSAASDASSIKILSPSGAAIAPTTANTEITELHCGRIVTVVAPEPGTWRVELTGKGQFWMEAQVQSDIHFLRAEFVREGGRPGHEGLFRIDGQPVAGKPAMIRTSISAEGARITGFYLANEQGELIQKLELRPVDRASEEFMGTADLPNVPFRIAVTGIDSSGKQYQRFYSSLFHAESLEVSWNHAFDELAAGSTRQAQFTIRNAGASGTFKVTAVDAHQFAGKVEPAELTLASGQTGTVMINLSVPATAQAGTGDDVVVMATSTAGPTTSNSAVVHFSVVGTGR